MFRGQVDEKEKVKGSGRKWLEYWKTDKSVEGSKQAPRVILPEQGCPAPNDVIKIQAPYQAGGAVNCYHPYTYYQQAVAV